MVRMNKSTGQKRVNPTALRKAKPYCTQIRSFGLLSATGLKNEANHLLGAVSSSTLFPKKIQKACL